MMKNSFYSIIITIIKMTTMIIKIIMLRTIIRIKIVTMIVKKIMIARIITMIKIRKRIIKKIIKIIIKIIIMILIIADLSNVQKI